MSRHQPPWHYRINVSIVVEADVQPSPEEAAETVMKSLRERMSVGTADALVQVTAEPYAVRKADRRKATTNGE